MKDDKNKQFSSDYPAGRSNEGGNFPESQTGEKHVNKNASTTHRSEKDPQGSNMGLESQPKAVNLNKGESAPGERQDQPGRNAPGQQDDTGKGEGDTNTPGYGASNNTAGV